MDILTGKTYENLSTLKHDIEGIMHSAEFSKECEDLSVVTIDNPAKMFTHDCKNGKYNDMPDEDFACMKYEYEKASEFWYGDSYIRANYRTLYLHLIPKLAEVTEILDYMTALNSIPYDGKTSADLNKSVYKKGMLAIGRNPESE